MLAMNQLQFSLDYSHMLLGNPKHVTWLWDICFSRLPKVILLVDISRSGLGKSMVVQICI